MTEWCTGEPPKEEGKYLVTVIGVFSLDVIRADRVKYFYPDNWKWVCTDGNYLKDSDVLAWRKNPTPYTGDFVTGKPDKSGYYMVIDDDGNTAWDSFKAEPDSGWFASANDGTTRYLPYSHVPCY